MGDHILVISLLVYNYIDIILARHTKTHELATVKVEEPHERKLQSEAMTYQLLLR